MPGKFSCDVLCLKSLEIQTDGKTVGTETDATEDEPKRMLRHLSPKLFIRVSSCQFLTLHSQLHFREAIYGEGK